MAPTAWGRLESHIAVGRFVFGWGETFHLEGMYRPCQLLGQTGIHVSLSLNPILSVKCISDDYDSKMTLSGRPCMSL